MPGPTKTPSAILKANGSRLINGRKDEPEAIPGIPDCPTWLKGEARAEWFRVIPQLQAMKVLSLSDRAVVVGYCQQWGKWVLAEKRIARSDHDTASQEYRRMNITSETAYASMLKTAAKLGLSPSDRAGVKTVDQQKGNDTEQRLNIG